jgi:hypothetical protein
MALIYSWLGHQTLSPLLISAVLATIVATYLYNGVLKNSVIAPLIMGLCRLGNFWIGGLIYLTSAADLTVTQWSTFISGGLIMSLGTMIYVTALTALSRFEVQSVSSSRGQGARWAALILCFSAAHPLVGLSLGILGWGALSAILVSAWIATRTWRVARGIDLSAAQVQRGVGAGIRGVALVNVALCLGLGGWWTAGLIMMMAWSASKVGRWFYAT